jgi:protein-S-isoprenylcysteine O-methyltransferase Ste14
MSDARDQLAALDAKLGRAWAKAEILLGLLVAGAGLLLGGWQVSGARNDIDWMLVAWGLMLFVLGGYLASAGHRSHLYRWNNRNTVVLIDEIRRLKS